MTNLESIFSMRFFSIPLPIIPMPMKPIGDIIFMLMLMNNFTFELTYEQYP